MPRGDRTGPWGYGPRTGRGAGYCSGFSEPGYMNPDVPDWGRGRGFGRGWGRGRGRGWGRGRGFGRGCGRGLGLGRRRRFGGRGWDPIPDPYYEPYPYPERYYDEVEPEINPKEEKNYLEKVVVSLENELKEVKERIQELSKREKK